MKRSIFLILFLLSSFAHSVPAKRVNLSFDAALFRGEGKNLIWEIYYSFPDTLLKYEYVNEGNYEGRLKIDLLLISSGLDTLTDSWELKHTTKSPSKKLMQDLMGEKKYSVSPGKYEVVLKVRDVYDPSTKAEKKFKFTAESFPEKTIGISQIQLARFISADTTKNDTWNKMFVKNNIYVVPNPEITFYGDNPILRGYYEIYNAATFGGDEIEISYRLDNALNKEIVTLNKSLKPYSDGMGQIVELSLDPLTSGLYFLTASIVNKTKNSNDTIRTKKRFYYINPEMPPEQLTKFIESGTFEQSEFSTMSDARLELEFQQAKYLATKDEKEKFEILETTEAKQRFLYRFWKLRDTDNQTPVNEKLVEYRRNIDYANKFFKVGELRDGWRTDRGRILLVYGQPTEIERFPQEGNNRPYERWFYAELRGGSEFFFVDRQGISNYLLVHSNMTGEMYDPDWFRNNVQIFRDNNDTQDNGL